MAGIVGLLVDSKRFDGAGSSQKIFSKMADRLSHRGALRKFDHRLSNGRIYLGIISRDDVPSHVEKHHQMKQLLVDSFAVSIDDIPNQVITSLQNPKSRTKPSSEHMLTTVGVTDDNQVRIFRSLDGVRPLYFAKLDYGFAFSTERKAIWNVHPSNPETLAPGWVLSIAEEDDWELIQVHSRSIPKVSTVTDVDTQIVKLQNALLKSVRRLDQTRKCGVLFSGGVDSSLVALLSKRECEDTLLISAASAHSKDYEKTQEIASLLAIEHKLIQFDADTVWDILPEVIYAIETSNRMDVEIAIPFFLAAKIAREKGCQVLVSGQGPDELFAGYAKYETSYKERGAEKVREELWSDFSITHEANIARDERAIEYHGVETFFPYLDLKFSDTALSTPVKFLLDPDHSPNRKILFRKLAKRIGLPDDVADAQKHATQYSSGSSEVLREAVAMNVSEARGLSKKKTSHLVQTALHTISHEIGIPIWIKMETKLEMNLDSTNRLLQRVGPLPTCNLG